jgi:hypothetical protein
VSCAFAFNFSSDMIVDNSTVRAIRRLIAPFAKERRRWSSERRRSMGKERRSALIFEGCTCFLNY